MSNSVKKRTGVWKVIAIAFLVLIAAIVALPFIVDVNQFKPELESRLSTALGREIKLGRLKLSVLSGSLVVDDISIADNSAFSPLPFVSAKSLKVAVELKPLIFSKSLRISGIRLEHPSIALIRSAAGTWNFSDLGSTKPAGTTPKPNPSQSGSFSGNSILIRQLEIEGGWVAILGGDERRKPSIYNDVSITASDLSYTTAFPFRITASMPGQGKLRLEGKAGPLNNRDMLLTPMEAELAVKQFDLIASGFTGPESGLAGVFDFSGTVQSDGKQVRSKGQASANKLRIMKSGLPAGRQISLQYGVNYDLVHQSGQLSDTSIGSGKAIAHLTGDFERHGTELMLKMALRGTDMPMQDLTALLPAFGVALPKGASLQGGYLNTNLVAEGPVETMVITGTAEVSKTRLVGFDLPGKMAAIAALAGIKSGQDTEIEKFVSSFRMTQEGIQVGNLLLLVPALGELSGDGKIAGDQSLDFTMNANLKPGGAIRMGLSRLVSGGDLKVPFFVRGTASEPKFVPNAEKAAGGLLGSILGQGKKEGQQDTGKALGDTLRNLFNKKK